ncbi:uncharacterized protein LOC131856670 [Cryptomeria japonica]|uniref:uncharacterized protein LOC131856670 n=1 Tax=Cryptomeria japonica TaxID=3369 RepID=UPI0027D9F7C0|nr:uncharacterized protein LOC131856670 [Cryptomeria japonica]
MQDRNQGGPSRVILDKSKNDGADLEVLLDIGENLMIRRTLIILEKEKTQIQSFDDSWLRTNIFQTRCTSGKKVCQIIIDSGSCENMVSREMVDKLNLQCEKNPHPYRIAWFKKGNEVTIDKRCPIKFSIGKTYKDKVWCDVIPMDACHVLLGRPWQYDRKVMHDGERNTYTFWKEGSKVILLPLKDVGEAKNMLSERELVKEMKVMGFCYALMVQEEEGGGIPIPIEVAKVLKEYSDVIANELPDGLPPKRDIHHHLDLIPGASLPNQTAYRMSPTQHAELNKKVMDIMKKDVVRESMSSCVVPALLTPKKDGPQYFSKIELRSGYHQIRIQEGDEWKTSFKTRDGLYEWMSKEEHLKHLQIILDVLRKEKLYANLKQCSFMQESLVFLGFIVSVEDCTKGKKFMWTNEAEESFKFLKKKVIEALILALQDFEKVFEVDCDASHVGIGAVLSQAGKPITFFSEKLNEARKNYSSYDLEFYAVVQAL